MKKFLAAFMLGLTFWGGHAQIVDAYYIQNPPEIDGRFDDVYSGFKKIDEFYQFEPHWGKRGTERTEVFLGYDDSNLYVAFKCYDTQPEGIRASLTQREKMDNLDTVTLYLDTFNTKRRGFIFGATPQGIQFDGIRDDESRRNRKDFSWDALWESRGEVFDWGYFVEMKIPFKSIRFPAHKDIQEWGMVAVRRITRKGEAALSVKMDKNIRGFLSQASTLRIDRKVHTGRNIEMIPVFVGNRGSHDKQDPQLGVTLKYGISSNLTTDFAYNPDFSQIEADAGKIDVNQRFPLRYAEKRPFFLESKSIFDMPLPLFYSRRIADPRWGAKLTGRVGNSVVGIVSTFDEASYEDLDNIVEGGEESAQINVFRYKYQFRDSNYFGMYVSNKSWNNENNLVLSGDTFLRFSNFAFKFQGAYTNTSGKEGNAINSSFGYNTRKFSCGVGYNQYSPDLDAQVGFLRRINYRTYYLHTGYTLYPEKEYLRRINQRLFFTQNFDWQTGDLVDSEITYRFGINSFKNSSLNFRVTPSMEKYLDTQYDKLNFRMGYKILLSKMFSIDASLRFGDSINYDETDPYLGYSYTADLRTYMILFDRMNIQLGYKKYLFYNPSNQTPVYNMNILRFKHIYLFSRPLSSRFIYEYNDYYDENYFSLLFTYQTNPGTAIHLGAMTQHHLEDGEPIKSWSIFLKLSYLLRV